jgi:hypothetical protein
MEVKVLDNFDLSIDGSIFTPVIKEYFDKCWTCGAEEYCNDQSRLENIADGKDNVDINAHCNIINSWILKDGTIACFTIKKDAK